MLLVGEVEATASAGCEARGRDGFAARAHVQRVQANDLTHQRRLDVHACRLTLRYSTYSTLCNMSRLFRK